MKLMLIILTIGGIGLATRAAPVQRHRLLQRRHHRAVPETSYAAAPVFEEVPISVVASDTVNNFEADNGISVEVKGYQKSIGPNEEGQAMEGQYSYTAPDGTPVTVQWTADETGFHANVEVMTHCEGYDPYWKLRTVLEPVIPVGGYISYISGSSSKLHWILLSTNHTYEEAS